MLFAQNPADEEIDKEFNFGQTIKDFFKMIIDFILSLLVFPKDE